MKPAWYYEPIKNERREEVVKNILELRSRMSHLMTRAERVAVQEAIKYEMREI